MQDKIFKTRVEISLIVEFDVEACHEDNAAAAAETVAGDLASEMVKEIVYGDTGIYCASYGVRCTEASCEEEE